MIKQFEITLPPFPKGFHLITHIISEKLKNLPETGLLNIFIRHTSAGLMINENADPSVRTDFTTILNRLIPEGDPAYVHTDEGEDDMPAHVKSALTGVSISIPITNGRMNLGTWQGIFLCEFRNRGGNRKLVITVYE
jgi:secondary thiamine-phosphate synthase enzyme